VVLRTSLELRRKLGMVNLVLVGSVTRLKERMAIGLRAEMNNSDCSVTGIQAVRLLEQAAKWIECSNNRQLGARASALAEQTKPGGSGP
jgi:hypothetical protein